MRILTSNTGSLIEVSRMIAGDNFKYMGEIYIKIDDYMHYLPKNAVFALNLAEGGIIKFSPDTPVEPVQAELYVYTNAEV